jgi:hypothetical protein
MAAVAKNPVSVAIDAEGNNVILQLGMEFQSYQ